MKDDDEQQQDWCEASLNDSFEDDDELIKEEMKESSKKKTKKDANKKAAPKKETPKEDDRKPLDPAEVMPNLQIGVKEKKRRAPRRGEEPSDDSESEQQINP